MKNKSLKFLLSLTVISCLLFTACGTDETIAPTAEATTEFATESAPETSVELETESTPETKTTTEAEIETEPTAELETEVSAESGTIEGYEVTEEPEEETIDKSELNDIGNESYNGEDEPVVEEPTVETPAEDEGTAYTLTEGDKEALRMLGATEDEINSIKTEEQFNALLDILMQRGGIPGGSSGNSGSGGSGNSGGGNSGGSGGNVVGGGESNDGPANEDIPWGPVPELPTGDGSLPGSM